MPYNPSQALSIKAELQINGVWTTVTSRSRSAGGVVIRHAEGDGANSPQTSRCRVVLGNDDGWLTEDNPSSPWWPYVGRGTPIRLSLTGILASDAARFTGQIDYMEAIYPGGQSSAMDIEAIGTWGVLESDEEEPRSALFRTATGPFFGPVNAVAYWSLEDPDGTRLFRWGLTGVGPVMAAVDASVVVDAAANNTMRGSDPVVTVTNPAGDGGLTAAVPAYTDTGGWILSLPVRFTGETGVAKVLTASTTVPIIEVRVIPATTTYTITLKNAAGGTVASASGGFASLSPTSDWIGFTLTSDGVSNDITAQFRNSQGINYGGPSIAGGAGAHAQVLRVTALNYIAVGTSASVGHVTLIPTSNFSAHTSFARAIHGWENELADARIARLGNEAGVSITVLGGSSQRMGSQPSGTLTGLLTDCQQVDQGLFADDRADSRLIYRTQAHLYTQLPQVTVPRGALTTDTRPVWDHRRTRNQWTVSRSGGGTSTQSDETHVAKIQRRVKDTASGLNLASIDQLDSQARWRVNVTTAPGPRYSSLGINLRNGDGALLADAVLGMDAGDRLLIAEAAFPTQHPPGGADQMVRGWEEHLDADQWEFRPVSVPYQPYDLVGRWPLLAKELHAAIDATTTSIDIANTDITQPMLATSAADVGSGYSITVGAEEMQLTAVAASTITYGAVGTASNANNANVTPGIPASTAQGNLMVMVAAIRNSGAGVPSTPAGWTRLPVFPATSNVQIFDKIAGASESAPTVSFTGGVANADTSAQIIRLPGKWHNAANVLIGSASCLNASAQDITYPGLSKPIADDSITLIVGWKQDDWTSATTFGPFTEIAEVSTTTGDDQAFVWGYHIQTTATARPAGTFAITGGTSQISRGAILALRCDYQTATVVRGVNGISAAHSAADAVTMTRPSRWGL